MKNILSFALSLLILVTVGCDTAQSQKKLITAIEVQEKIQAEPTITVVDVRTPGEYQNGHLANAINIDWNGDDFAGQIAKLDTSKPIIVYCQSGGRSAKAAEKMMSMGFHNFYEMQGGMMKWRAAGLKESLDAAAAAVKGKSLEDFNKLINADDLVLVDFYAEWCAPCKEMKPYLDEITKSMSSKVKVLRIDADADAELCKQLKVDALPVLHLYKKGKLVWENTGFIGKIPVVAEINKY
jgi:thioredoxin